MRAAGRGPALVIVRDKQGHVFGGFASVPLQKSGKFYGALVDRSHRPTKAVPQRVTCICNRVKLTSRRGHASAGDFHSFVFSLLPEFRIHKPSGVNSNFQWTGVGFSQLPNGIAFGGQVRYCRVLTCHDQDVSLHLHAIWTRAASLQVGHFGLLIDGTLDHGHSRAAATYNRYAPMAVPPAYPSADRKVRYWRCLICSAVPTCET